MLLSPRKGFTLVEISIVMIIISIIAGAGMVGTNLLRSARVSKVLEQKAEIEQAVELFKDRYKALPGDMATATEYWGAEDPDYATCAYLTTPSTDAKTCNGNGNDFIDRDSSSDYRAEYFRLWQHLSNAGLISGTYTGINGMSAGNRAWYVGGVNAPLSPIANATWAMMKYASAAYYFTTMPSNAHIMHFAREGTNQMLLGAVLTPKELWNIDMKYDDGIPSSGKIMSFEPVAADTWQNRNACATSDVPADAKYNLSKADIECAIIFILDF